MKRFVSVVTMAALALIALNFGCENKQQEPQASQTPEVKATPPEFPQSQIPEPSATPAPEAKAAPEPAVTETPEEDVTTIQPSEPKAKPKPKTAAKPKEKYAAPAKGGKTYVVKKGDTLQEISQKFYGTTKNWRKIYNANKGKIKDPNSVVVGTKLVIP